MATAAVIGAAVVIGIDPAVDMVAVLQARRRLLALMAGALMIAAIVADLSAIKPCHMPRLGHVAGHEQRWLQATER